MRIRLFCLILFVASFQLAFGQASMSSRVHFEWKGAGQGEIQSTGLFYVKTASRDWSGSLDLQPFVKDPELADSLQAAGKSLKILLTGRFPGMMPDLIPTSASEERFQMEVKIQILDSVLIRMVDFQVHQAGDKNNNAPNSYGTSTCLGKISFVLELNPARFGLNRSPWNWNRPLFVQVESGIVNKH
ncbi:MAG TPA: hypothetical protein PLK63_01155 [Catalimonadaceae bacterium]|nr:hypothetical protein [Catalimonadaceae bacterium]